MTHYAALKDGRVVATRTSTRTYTHAVLFKTDAGYFATFHGSYAAARRQQQSNAFHQYRDRTIVPLTVTARRAQVGQVVVVAQGVL